MSYDKSQHLGHNITHNGAGPSHVVFPAGNTQIPISPPGIPVEIQGTEATPLVPQASLKSVGNAYVLWFPFGLLGFHHFYLKNFNLGIGYLTTFGLFGFGWLVDFWRIPMLVKDANVKIEAKWIWEHEIANRPTHEDVPKFDYETPKRLSDCYLLGFTTGLLGLHHHYLRRHGWGLLYLLTLGLFGVGYISDWIRMPIHLKRYNEKEAKRKQGIKEPPRYYLDEAYVLAFPGGIFGFHNFYLGRYPWGLLYMCTLGMLGIGWLIDLIRMPYLVQDANLRALSGLSPLSPGIEQGVKYHSTDVAPHVDPHYSDYNSSPSYSQHSHPCTEISSATDSDSQATLNRPRVAQQPALPSSPHSCGMPEPPPPYSPLATPDSIIPEPQN